MIKQKYRKCKICECIGGIFITRKKKLASGVIAIYPDNKCTLCANEESRERYYRLRSDPVWKEEKRLKLLNYKRNNKELMKEQARIYWIKNREEIIKRRNLRKKPSNRTKNPLKKNSHHRVPTNKLTYSIFDFRKNNK